MPTSEGALSESLGARLFRGRLELIVALDDGAKGVATPGIGQKPAPWDGFDEASVRRDTAELLRTQVVAMNMDNFLVRPRRRMVEVYREPTAWTTLTPEAVADMVAPGTGLASRRPNCRLKTKKPSASTC